MLRTFNWHNFRFPTRKGACLALLCVPLLSIADIVLDTGPFEGEVTLTNLTFVSLEAYEQYKQGVLNEISTLEGDWVLMYGQIGLIDDNLRVTDGHLHTASAKFQIWSHTQSAVTTGYPYAEEGITAMNLAWSEVNSARSRLTTLTSDALTVSNQIATTRSLVQTDAYRTTGTFATSAGDDSSSSGCQCPDYTSLLQSIEQVLGYIRTAAENVATSVANIDTNFNDFYTEWADVFTDFYDFMMYPFYDSLHGLDDILHTGSGVDSSGNFRSLGQGLGYIFKTNGLASARILSELLALHDVTGNYWLNKTATADSNISQFVYDVFNPLRQLFANDVTDASSYSQYYPAIAQTLNFLWTRNVHPTNTFSNPLFVTNTSPMTLEITPDSAGSAEHPINVSVGNPEVVVATTNGVLVTNKVALTVSLDTYSGENGEALNVNVINFDDLKPIFDLYFLSGSGQQEAEDDKEEENDESEEELDDSLNADGSNPQFYLSAQPFHDALTKYRQMLVSIEQLIPDNANPPRFYFDYSFKFSSPGSGDSSDSDSIQVVPISPGSDHVSHMGRVLSVFRSFCSVIWLGLVIASALWLLKWSLFGISYATAISMSIASGDLSAVAKLLPGFLKDLLSAGDA